MKLANTVLWEDIKTCAHGKKERDKIRKQLERACDHLGYLDDAPPCGLRETAKVYLNRTLLAAFYWEQSPQGFDYWKNVWVGENE